MGFAFSDYPTNSNPYKGYTLTPAIIYSRPGCQACRITAKLFDKEGVPTVLRTITDDEVEAFREQGHRQLPVVQWKGDTWSGLRPDRITNY